MSLFSFLTCKYRCYSCRRCRCYRKRPPLYRSVFLRTNWSKHLLTCLYIGEWSLAVAFNTTDAFLKKWGDAQKLAWAQGAGWVFWQVFIMSLLRIATAHPKINKQELEDRSRWPDVPGLGWLYTMVTRNLPIKKAPSLTLCSFRSYRDAVKAGIFTAKPDEYFDKNACAVSILVVPYSMLANKSLLCCFSRT